MPLPKGTSTTAALFAIGYTPSELKEIMMDLDFSKFLDDKFGIIRDAVNFFDDYGLCPGDFASKFLGELVEKKTGNIDYTIEQLYK